MTKKIIEIQKSEHKRSTNNKTKYEQDRKKEKLRK